jgi:filamentous hemagglutinin family protein
MPTVVDSVSVLATIGRAMPGRRRLLAACGAVVAAAGPVLAQPAGGQAIHGGMSVVQSGQNLLVTTTNGPGTKHSAIDWQSFSVPVGSTTHFNQPTATSTSINRVAGPDPSAIFGTLSSNGRLVLVNPAGIAVGAGAVVDTAAFTASTLRMAQADALAGSLRFGDGTGAGLLRVDGQVLARAGDVVMIAPRIETGAQAVLVSESGAAMLAAGRKVELTGPGLDGIRFHVQAPTDQVLHLGTLRGDAVGIFAGTLRHSGLLQVHAQHDATGRVVLRARGDAAQAEVRNAVAAFSRQWAAEQAAGTSARDDITVTQFQCRP